MDRNVEKFQFTCFKKLFLGSVDSYHHKYSTPTESFHHKSLDDQLKELDSQLMSKVCVLFIFPLFFFCFFCLTFSDNIDVGCAFK